MTEMDWLDCDDTERLLSHAWDRVSDRRLRLLACGIVRRAWADLPDGRSRAAVEAAEAYADGAAGPEQLRAAAEAAGQAASSLASALAGALQGTRGKLRAHVKALLAQAVAAHMAAQAAGGLPRLFFQPPVGVAEFVEWQYQGMASTLVEKQVGLRLAGQGVLVRDVVGNPFRLAAPGGSWLGWNGGALRELAQAIHEEGSFADMPILADALEEAGCADEEMVRHCREHPLHIRGCWVLDFLRAREQPEAGAVLVLRQRRPPGYWTIRQPVEAGGRHVRQTSCPAHYAGVTLRVEPYEGPEGALFVSEVGSSRVDATFRPLLPVYLASVVEGLRDVLADEAEAGRDIAGIRIVLAALGIHEIDSNEPAFRIAAADALVQALEGGGLVRVEDADP